MYTTTKRGTLNGWLLPSPSLRHLTKTSNPTRFSTSASEGIQSKLQTQLLNLFSITSPTASSSRTSASVQPNATPSHKWLHTIAMVPQLQWLFNFHVLLGSSSQNLSLLHLSCLHHLNVHDSHSLGLFHLILFLAI